jgi:hypothetical protein
MNALSALHFRVYAQAPEAETVLSVVRAGILVMVGYGRRRGQMLREARELAAAVAAAVLGLMSAPFG